MPLRASGSASRCRSYRSYSNAKRRQPSRLVAMRRNRNAKILATLGPTSSSPEVIRALFEAGADVFRLNFSHGTHADHRARYDAIRAVEREAGRPIGVLADLQGPKLRVGIFTQGRVTLEPGRPFRLDLDMAPGDERRVPLP